MRPWLHWQSDRRVKEGLNYYGWSQNARFVPKLSAWPCGYQIFWTSIHLLSGERICGFKISQWQLLSQIPVGAFE
jgi:hypothetical protein